MAILRTANLNEDVKFEKLQKANEHLALASKQRAYYNKWRELSKTCETIECDGVKGTFSVLSFDLAQNLKFPASPQQPASSYFASPRSCALFGIHGESTNEQLNYVVDEADSIGKGPNATISFLHHYLESRLRKDILILWADNCVSQNKNNAVLQYPLWGVLTGKSFVCLCIRAFGR